MIEVDNQMMSVLEPRAEVNIMEAHQDSSDMDACIAMIIKNKGDDSCKTEGGTPAIEMIAGTPDW